MHALVGLAVAEMNSGAVTSDERRDGVAAGMRLIAQVNPYTCPARPLFLRHRFSVPSGDKNSPGGGGQTVRLVGSVKRSEQRTLNACFYYLSARVVRVPITWL